MRSIDKIKCAFSISVILVSANLVKAQTLRTDIAKSTSQIASKIHVPGINAIQADELRELSKSLKATVPMRSTVAEWWLESSIDTLFALLPGDNMSVSKTFYAYNTNGDSTQILYKVYNDTTKEFVNSFLDQFEYDGNFNVTRDLTWVWDKSSTSFKEQSQTMYMYNSSNLETERYSQYMISGTWTNNVRTTTAYDSQNRETEVISQKGNMSGWANNDRTSYTYSQGVFPTLELYQTWNGAQWVDEERYMYTLNSDNNIDTETYQLSNNGLWADSAKYTYTYDSSKRITQILEQFPKTGNWVDSTRTTITYYSATDMHDFSSILIEAWNGSAWVKQSQTVYTYNSDNKLTEYLFQNWNGSSWDNYYHILLFYDSNGNEVRYLAQLGYGGTWLDDFSITNYYTQTRPVDVPTPIEQPIAGTPGQFELLQNYPNPFNPSTVIQYKLAKSGSVRLTVYDITGRQVATLINQTQGAGVYLVRFNAAQLASGIYFYRLQADGFNQIRKMLLIR